MGIKEIYQILEVFVEAGIVEQYLEIYCPYCHRYSNRWFKYIAEIPEEVYCPNCDEEISVPLKHAVVVYRVI